MNCHNAIHEGAQYGTKEIDKIHTAAGYEKESRSYNLDDYGQRVETPVVWNKAHNLPDHVFFSHAQHVHPNTANIDCRQCHGNVETYTLGRVSTIDEVNAYTGPMYATVLPSNNSVSDSLSKAACITASPSSSCPRLLRRLRPRG